MAEKIANAYGHPLAEVELQKFKELSKQITEFSNNKQVSVGGLKTLFNIQTQITSMVEQYSDRIIRLLKQNHMLD